jgi:hypothetical protein
MHGEGGCQLFGVGYESTKKREMGGPFALDGHRLMNGHINQPKVGIDGGKGIEEERWPGRNVCGGVVSLLGGAN